MVFLVSSVYFWAQICSFIYMFHLILLFNFTSMLNSPELICTSFSSMLVFPNLTGEQLPRFFYLLCSYILILQSCVPFVPHVKCVLLLSILNFCRSLYLIASYHIWSCVTFVCIFFPCLFVRPFSQFTASIAYLAFPCPFLMAFPLKGNL